MVSVFGRQGNDPWSEAELLSELPRSEAIQSLAQTRAAMPTSIWPLQVATAIADRLIALLPAQAGGFAQNVPPAVLGTKTSPVLRIVVILACVACALAFEAGVFASFG